MEKPSKVSILALTSICLISFISIQIGSTPLKLFFICFLSTAYIAWGIIDNFLEMDRIEYKVAIEYLLYGLLTLVLLVPQVW